MNKCPHCGDETTKTADGGIVCESCKCVIPTNDN